MNEETIRQIAETILTDLISEETTMGSPPGPENDMNSWATEKTKGEAFRIICNRIREKLPK